MIISDLSYMERVYEAPSVVGGFWGSVQINVIDVKQLATSKATALAYFGDANAKAYSINSSDNGQLNIG
ncbi:MAG: hypothetical protein JO235_21570 [Chroococcidiopsidaceae cyanobacterium CP_BM_RX_35]|nr:hypothetical protein [Chroococcidiopsidaceae cyanobacterium CP_BM_RX_35]